jgi:hypothetical protein
VRVGEDGGSCVWMRCRSVLQEQDFAVLDLPSGDRFEVFGPSVPDNQYFTTGPVVAIGAQWVPVRGLPRARSATGPGVRRAARPGAPAAPRWTGALEHGAALGVAGSPAVEDANPCWRLHPGTDGQRDGLGRGRRYLQAGAGSPPSPPRSQDGGARNAVDRERLGGERYGQEEQAASHAGSGVSLGGLRGGRSRPAGEAEAQGLRGGDAPAARRAGGHAGVGQGVGRQALHRVRGSGHRRQGGGRSSGSPSG